MTPEAQRIAIAGACGWTRIETVSGELWGKPPSGNQMRSEIPDYLNDLNAMHDAEKVLTDEQHQNYVRLLVSPFAYMLDGISQPAAQRLLCATAAQRAEAFLKTLSLWDDTK